jgi:long-chain acyl-CoA synthetase
MVLHSIQRFGDKPVMRWFSHDLSTVHVKNYPELGRDMQAIFGGIASLGYQKGDRIALCSETSCYWVMCDLGVQARGGVLVAIYPNLKPAEVRYILNDSGTKAIFVDTQANLEKVQSIERECGELKNIFVIEEFDAKLKKVNVFGLEELMKKGEEYNNANPKAF